MVRWGIGIALLLVVQSLAMAALFWLLAQEQHRAQLEASLSRDCRAFALLPRDDRSREIRRQLDSDIHRDRFLALVGESGALIAGNIAAVPKLTPGESGNIPVRPTELPGKISDVAHARICALPGGQRLFTGLDLDNSEAAVRIVERTLAFAILPGLLLAGLGGFFAARRAGRQLDAVRHLSQRIMAGELSKRLPVATRRDSFGQLCAHINAMLDRIETLMVEVRGVGDDIAHQVRTPLTRLRARIEREMNEAADPAAFAATSRQALVDIDQALAIVTALLRIHDIEHQARRSGFRNVDLAGLVTDVAELHTPAAEEAGHAILVTIAAPATFEGDPDLLGEALSNLIDNAIKFSPAGGDVRVSLTSGPRISVGDDGQGIASSDRARVFNRFARGREWQNVPGSGLGLSLVAAISRLHGMAVEVAPVGSEIALVAETDCSDRG